MIIRLQPEPAAYRYMWAALTQDHVQQYIEPEWQGPEGYHTLCRMLDEGHWFAVPVIGGEAGGLVWGEVCGCDELEGHLAFNRKISTSELLGSMEEIFEYCSTEFKKIRVVKDNLHRAARMFIRRCGFESDGDFFTKDLTPWQQA